MTQKCQHDEQLLDYVYGELSDAERKIFADHLVTCTTCPAQVSAFGDIRQEFQKRPPIEPAGEAMQRMTALLMQAAATEHGAAAGAAPDGGGKVLAFRARGLRRILFHPAGGIMAVAAAAMFWVVFRAQPVAPTGLSAPSAPTAIEAPRGMEGAAAPVVVAAAAKPAELEKNAPAKEASRLATELAGDGKLGQDRQAGLVADARYAANKAAKDDFDGLRASSTKSLIPAEAKPAQPSRQQLVATKSAEPPAPAAKPTTVAQLDKSSPDSGSAVGKKSAAQYRSSGPAIVAMADQAYEKKADKAEGYQAVRPSESWSSPPAAEPAPPPPPPPAAPAQRALKDEESPSVREGMARTQERRKQKVVDELTNQELGSLAAGAAVGAPSAGSQANDNRYAQRYPANNGPADSSGGGLNQALANQADDAPTPAATPAMPSTSTAGRGTVTGSSADDGATALATAKEQLRRGQCAEANVILTKLERTSPMMYGLADARADWQSACATPSQQLLERRMRNEAPEPAPMAAPQRSMSKMHMPSPAPAKPAPRKAAKAADAVK